MAETARLGAALMALAMAALSACAAGGPLPQDAGPNTPERTVREGPALPGTPGAVITMTAQDSSDVVASVWGPEKPRAVILALHGFGDYGQLTFRGPAADWADRGIATIAPDQRGFGRNASRGRWPGADVLIADARAYADQVRARHPCTPLTVLGHSMGGGVVLAAAPEIEADALVLAAPAIWGGKALNPLHRLAAWAAATIAPERRFTGKGIVRIVPSDNDDALHAIWADPLYLAPPSAREIFGLVRLTDRAAEAARQVSTPALMLLGTQDQIVPNRTVREVFAHVPGETRVIEYPEGWHLLFRDRQAARVWEDVATWALDAAPPEGCPE